MAPRSQFRGPSARPEESGPGATRRADRALWGGLRGRALDSARCRGFRCGVALARPSHAVTGTLGPKGRNVVIDKQYGGPTITKDGVTVAKEVELTTEALVAEIPEEKGAMPAMPHGGGMGDAF